MAIYKIFWEVAGEARTVETDDYKVATGLAGYYCTCFMKDVWLYASDAKLWWMLPYMNGARGMRGVNLQYVPKSYQLLVMLEG